MQVGAFGYSGARDYPYVSRGNGQRRVSREMWGLVGDMEMDAGRFEVLTQRVIQCVIHVHRVLGPGFLESIYKRALVLELSKRGLDFEVEKEVPVYYERQEVGRHRLDLVIENRLIVELKTVESISRAHYAQVRSYLRATGFRLALLINFSDVKADFRRIES